jgi:nucleoside-diphosphate-sugar epimerase
MTVMVTGAFGFVGLALCHRLDNLNYQVVATTREIKTHRNTFASSSKLVTPVSVGDLGLSTDWSQSLKGVDVVVHLAARVHVLRDSVADPLSEFRRVNVLGSLNLAEQAAAAGVRRFIYMSSIKVNGEATSLDQRFKASDSPAPEDPYAISKYEAEIGLRKIASETGMEVVIIRPPLVYGPGVKANFHSMMRWLDRGVPLPLGAINNRRSLVALDNLVDLIAVCIDHPAAANQIFLAGDGEDFSTTELLERLAKALGKPARLIPVPGSVLKIAAALLGRGDIAQRICGSLQIDISRTCDLLGWAPPVTVDEALSKTAESYINSKVK